MIITHWGLSGPAILKLSAFAARGLAALNYHFDLYINCLPAFSEEEIKLALIHFIQRTASQQIQQKNPFHFPTRLWQYFLDKIHIEKTIRWGNVQAAQQTKLTQILMNSVFEVKGKTTFKEEFVTCGGIALHEINGHTMESKIHQGLYFAGEIMDVDGITGGFNFQHAWASGWCAAAGIAKAVNEIK